MTALELILKRIQSAKSAYLDNVHKKKLSSLLYGQIIIIEDSDILMKTFVAEILAGN